MHDVAPINPWVALAYLVAGVFFILALRGLSSPASSRRGNRFGMAGMAIAVVTTLVTHELANPIEVIGAIRSEEHTSELQSLMRISYAVFCLKKKKRIQKQKHA